MPSTSPLNEVEADNHEPPPKVQTSSPASQQSSLDSSITILVTDITPLRSTVSLPQQKSIKFAPLPVVEPKRRRVAPLGVSARSRRRIMQQREVEEMVEDGPAREYVEDPFVTLGRLVKNASRSLWKRLRKKEIEEVQDDIVVVEIRGTIEKGEDVPCLDRTMIQEEKADETEDKRGGWRVEGGHGETEHHDEGFLAVNVTVDAISRRNSWTPSSDSGTPLAIIGRRKSTGSTMFSAQEP